MSFYAQTKSSYTTGLQGFMSIYVSLCEGILVPLAGIEPALLAELDFECSRSAEYPNYINILQFYVQSKCAVIRLHSAQKAQGVDTLFPRPAATS